MKESLKEQIQGYCKVAVVKSQADNRMKELRPHIIKGMESKGLKKFSENGFSLEKRESIKRSVNVDELDKICKKKGIVIGTEVFTIRSKGGEIPDKVLKDLDKYFVLERSVEVDVKTVQKAVDNGFITTKDFDKIVVEPDPTISLYSSIDDAEIERAIREKVEDIGN